MGRQKYEFDVSSFSFKKARTNALRIIKGILLLVLVSFVTAVFAYAILSLFISTDTERRYSREIKTYEQSYKTLVENEELLGDVISGLQEKDNSIHQTLFNSAAPTANPMTSMFLVFDSDSIPDTKILKYTYDKVNGMMDRKDNVEETFLRIYSLLAEKGGDYPPMSIPLDDISYSRIGASCGNKLSPFLKAVVRHDGLDILAAQGSNVYATASGTVTNVIRSSKGSGNTIEILHDSGYVTRYEHLSSMSVSKGQRVSKGAKIGAVGMTGSVFAPHLHYEVSRDGVSLDPLGYMFADVDAAEYADMLFMAAAMKQSMD